jgi:hypothetical protein
MQLPLRISGRHQGLDDVDQTLDLHIGPQTSYGIRRQVMFELGMLVGMKEQALINQQAQDYASACALFARLLGQLAPAFIRLPVLHKYLHKPTQCMTLNNAGCGRLSCSWSTGHQAADCPSAKCPWRPASPQATCRASCSGAPVRERPRGGPSFQPPPPSSWLQCPHARIRSSAIRPIVSSTSSMVPWFWFTNTVTTVGPPSWKMIPVSLRT